MTDVVIAGAGVIGLSLALELERRGARVTVLEAGKALGKASSAAAGMLAVDDPGNPPALHPLARLSASLYPQFLDRLENLTGERVAFQTAYTLQAVEDEETPEVLTNPHAVVPELAAGSPRFRLLDEHSVDPRQLARALDAAIRGSSVDLREETALRRVSTTRDGVRVETQGQDGGIFEADYLVDCMGCWSPGPVAPVKGQMLAVTLPPSLPLEAVVRTKKVYIVPRTIGQNAGKAIIGATVEDAGFDTAVHSLDIRTLYALATALLPALAEAHYVESWAGLRPATADELPILGNTASQPRYLLATGHYRNGILLAPATATILAQTIVGEPPQLDIAAFSPERFQRQ